MSETKEVNPETGGPDRRRPGGPEGTERRTRHGFWTGVIAGGVAGAVLVGAIGLGAAKVSAAGGRFFGHGHGFAGHGFANLELRREQAEFAAEWVLRRVDATSEQQAQVKAIVGDTIEGLAPLAERHRENREAFAAELIKPSIDRAALEALRKAELQLAEEASANLVAALAEAASALTPEQRQELLELARRFHH